MVNNSYKQLGRGRMRKPSRWCTATRLTSMNRCLCVCMSVTAGFPGGSVVRNPPAYVGDAGDAGSIPGSGWSPGGGNGSPLQSSCRETPRTEGPGGLQSMGSQRGKPDLGTNQPQRWLCLAHLSRDVCVCLLLRCFDSQVTLTLNQVG